MSNLVGNPEDSFCHEEAHILCCLLLTDCLFTGSRLSGSYFDGTTRSDLLRALETSTDTESSASTGKKVYHINTVGKQTLCKLSFVFMSQVKLTVRTEPKFR